METDHRVVIDDARELTALDDDAVELVVTSPPYPLIEMWDELFGTLNPDIETALAAGDGQRAFELMHAELDTVWAELKRVLVDGGIACINIGDATRTLDGQFRVFQNHARVIDAFTQLGFDPLPEILWRKPVNSAAKFMGSGMIPPNAYVTLEHEYILVFRNGPQRQFEPRAPERYQAAYFWEERNRWFSDVWTDITGEIQTLSHEELRDRSGAYPFAIPYRLINMYSAYGDTVLDPFWGTGTTTLAAMTAARNSVGYELNPEFAEVFEDRVSDWASVTADIIQERLQDHREFVKSRQAAGQAPEYDAKHYGFPVMTKQERTIQFYDIKEITSSDGRYRVRHQPR